MNPLVYVIIFSIIMGLCVLLLVKEGYIMTMGDYGKPEPKFCSESSPSRRKDPDSDGHDFISCNACAVSCPDPKNCYECLKKLSYPGVL